MTTKQTTVAGQSQFSADADPLVNLKETMRAVQDAAAKATNDVLETASTVQGLWRRMGARSGSTQRLNAYKEPTARAVSR